MQQTESSLADANTQFAREKHVWSTAARQSKQHIRDLEAHVAQLQQEVERHVGAKAVNEADRSNAKDTRMSGVAVNSADHINEVVFIELSMNTRFISTYVPAAGAECAQRPAHRHL